MDIIKPQNVEMQYQYRCWRKKIFRYFTEKYFDKLDPTTSVCLSTISNKSSISELDILNELESQFSERLGKEHAIELLKRIGFLTEAAVEKYYK
jgi:hypothetical protein